jgi:hypothetical protein
VIFPPLRLHQDRSCVRQTLPTSAYLKHKLKHVRFLEDDSPWKISADPVISTVSTSKIKKRFFLARINDFYCKRIIIVYSENHTKSLNTLCDQNVELIKC